MLPDLRSAFRQLTKTPGFSFVAILTLAVGIGSATVVFSALNAFYFKPLPHVTAPENELVNLVRTEAGRPEGETGLSYPDFLDVQRQATTLAAVWVHTDRTVIIAGDEIPDRQVGTQISWDAFEHLGVQPIRGRGFTASDAPAGAPPVALISSSLWRARFGGKAEILGSVVTLNGEPTTIVGVMPAGWRYPDLTDVWTPVRPDPEKPGRNVHVFHTRARLKPGVTFEQAQAELDAIMARLAADHPKSNTGVGVQIRPIRDHSLQETKHQTGLLFGAVMFVFLIACLNVTNLLLARGVSRSKEMAIRLALGAQRRRLIRQLAVENLLLGLLGGAAGLVLGLWGNDAVVAAIPIPSPFWLNFAFDLRVVGFAAILSVLAALIFGLVPSLRTSRPHLTTELKEGGRSSENSGPAATRLRNLLVVAELALALVLLVGAGLMMRSFLELRRQESGFATRNILTFRTGLPPAMYAEDSDVPRRFFDELLPRLRQLPDVESVAAVSVLPGSDGSLTGYLIEGQPPPKSDVDLPLARYRFATADYFSTVRIPLKAGRFFDDTRDLPDRTLVAIVDEAFAVKNFGTVQNALGKRLVNRDPQKTGSAGPGLSLAPKSLLEIVGVVGSIRHRLDRPPTEPTIYFPQRQNPSNFLSILVRSSGDPTRLLRDNSIRDAVMAVNRGIPIYYPLPLSDVVLRSETVWPRKFFGWLFTVFGAVALFLSCIGIYSVMSYNVTQRMQELGVRLALGAQPAEVIRLVVRRGLRLVACGIGAGLATAFVLANVLGNVLYGVSPHDPPTFALVPLLLAAVAVLACWLPSRRATLIDPNASLRGE